MYGDSAYGETAYGSVTEDLGVPIIAEVTLATTTLVLLVEIDALVQPAE